MILLRPKRLVLLLLGLYWPGFFILFHMPIPAGVRVAGMLDKTLHVLAYMFLTFLLGAAVSPDRRLSWRRLRSWLVLAGVLGYGVVDELVQARVGRTADVHDYIADVVGCCIALGVLTLLPFWPGFTVVVAGAVFALSNLTTANPAASFPAINAVFHVLAYGFFTALWSWNLPSRMSGRTAPLKAFALRVAGPVALLILTKASGRLLSRPLHGSDIALAVAGIAATALILSLRSGKGAGGNLESKASCPTPHQV